MKTYRSWKKMALMGGLLVTATSLTTLIAVSCSNSSNPDVAKAFTYYLTEGNGTQQTVKASTSAITIEPGVKFGDPSLPTDPIKKEKTYTAPPPSFTHSKDTPIADQQALVYFQEVLMLSLWMQSFTTQLQDFLSATPSELLNINPGFKTLRQLAFALAAPLNEGTKTARLGLHSISYISNIKSQVVNNYKTYDDATPYDAKITNNWTLNISDIRLNFQWWTTDKSNAVYWQGKDYNVDAQNKALWVNYPSDIKAKSEYNIGFNNLEFKGTQETVAKDDKWFYNGVSSIEDPTQPFKFTGLADNTATENVFKFLTTANKHRKGDILNGDFYKFVTSEEQKTNLTNLVSIFKPL